MRDFLRLELIQLIQQFAKAFGGLVYIVRMDGGGGDTSGSTVGAASGSDRCKWTRCWCL